MRKRKKRSSISELWEKIEEAVESYKSKKISKKAFDNVIGSASAMVNKSGMSDIIAKNLISPYIQNSGNINVKFTEGLKHEDYGVLAENNWTNVSIDPFGVYSFRAHIASSVSSGTPESDDFENERSYYFYQELLKLPPPYFIFIATLSKLSMSQEIFTAEKRGGKKIAPGGLSMVSYFPLLWALKQFEAFYKRIQNREMRSDFGIIWHEGEWIEKNKKQEEKK